MESGIFGQLRSPNDFRQSDAAAAALAFAGILAFAAVVVGAPFATALTFAAVLAFAVMLAGVAARCIRSGRIGAGLRVGFHGSTRHQTGDSRGDKKCSLCSAHNVLLFVWFMKNRLF